MTACLLVAATVVLDWQGYSFGGRNHSVQVPLVKSLMDPSLYRFDALRTWGEFRFKAGRFDTAASGRVEMDSYAIVNLAADYRISPLLLVRGRLDNLFDTEYEEVIGFGTAGISGYIGLTATLSR